MDYDTFRRKLMRAAGIDLGFYKENQMRRRLAAAVAKSGYANLSDYWRAIESSPALLKDLVDSVTINVSSFFRNREKFDELANVILPTLLASSRTLKVWSAGCSTGPEPYSVAIILSELAPGARHRIIATDINESALRFAREGVYTHDDVKEVKREFVQKYFTTNQGRLSLRDPARHMVEFRFHNLLSDSYEQDYDLIVCRNVMIYFTEEAKSIVFKGFYASLRPGGILFIGGTETMMAAPALGFEPVSPFFYRRRGDSM